MESYFEEVRDLLKHVLIAEAQSRETTRTSESELRGIDSKLRLLEDLVTAEEASEDARLAAWVARAI